MAADAACGPRRLQAGAHVEARENGSREGGGSDVRRDTMDGGDDMKKVD